MNGLEMKHLEFFVAVAEEGSFTRAALRLHITQPPLSLRIKQLEAMLKITLFDRTTRRVRLTSAGRVFLEKIQDTMQSLNAAVEASRLTARGLLGSLRVGYTGIASDSVLPQLLSMFGSLYPKIALEFLGPCTTGEVALSLLDEEIDVALCFLPLGEKRLESRRLRATELALVLPDRHPLARTIKISLKDLAEEPFVTYPASGGFHLRAAVDAECLRAGFRPRVVKDSRWTQTLLCLVAAGVGVAIVPKEQQARGMEGVTFRALIPSQAPLYHGIVWRKDDTNPFVANFLAVAQKAFPSKTRRPKGDNAQSECTQL
jgi:DNA-binding transcriptional LysR family regulator